MKQRWFTTSKWAIGCMWLSLLLALSWAEIGFAAVVDTEITLVPNVDTAGQQFGIAVAVNATNAAVGAQDRLNGAVYIYSLIGTNWQQTQLITAGDPSSTFDQFGASVALSSNLLAVGQPGNFMTNRTGEVYVYTNAEGGWSFQQKLDEVDALIGLGFGSTVDISSNTLVTGNPFESSDVRRAGAIYVFTQVQTNWLFQAKLKASTPSVNGSFGLSVAVDGDTILVGTGEANTGAAYIFVRDGTNWTQQQRLAPDDLVGGAKFGGSVALQGNLAVVSASGQTSGGANGGTVYIFNRTGTNWVLQQELALEETANNLPFGNTVALRNGTIVVGIPGRTVDDLILAGVVDMFQFDGTNWVLTQEVAATDAQSGASLGRSLRIGGAGIIAGAPGTGATNTARAGQGAAYIFSAIATNLATNVPASLQTNVTRTNLASPF